VEVIGKDAQDPGKQEEDLPEVEEKEAEIIRVKVSGEDTQDPGEHEEDLHEGQEEEQCWGSGSAGSTVCFWASRIRIHYSEVWIRIQLRIWGGGVPLFS
jgi:hypothetical protein